MTSALRLLLASLALPAALAACSSSSSSTSPDPTTARAQAETIAKGSNPCTSDSDCCIVTDGCISNALVVNTSNRDEVTSLIQEAAPPVGGCFGCIGRPYQVACVAGQCTAYEVERWDPDAGAPMAAYYDDDPSLADDHCGTLPLPDGDLLQTSSSTAVGSGLRLKGVVLGCGASVGL
jgi:hypothetical protein